MIITEQRLKEIILEEIQNIDHENILRELYLKKFSEHNINQSLLEQRDWFPLATTGLALGAGLALFSAVTAQDAEREAYWAAKAAEAEATLSSKETKIGEMAKQLKNFQAWSWTDDADPTSREAFPTIQFDEYPGQVFNVMPPEYAVFLQVAKDKEEGTFRYGVPDSVQDIKDIKKAITKADSELEDVTTQARYDFTKEFDSPGLYDSLSSEVGVWGIGGQVYLDPDGNLKKMQAIVPDFEDLEAYYGGPLPLTGVTVEELYNNFMFGNYMSSEEVEMVADYLDVEFDPKTELNPNLVGDTSQRAGQDIARLQQRNERKKA